VLEAVSIARRVAALLLMAPALDGNCRAVQATLFNWA
jgi:hypothetical protein